MDMRELEFKEIVFEIVSGIIELRVSDEQLELLDYIYQLAEANNLKDVIEIIEDYRIQVERCSKCGDAALETELIYEDRGEYFGFPSQEKMYSSRCSNCGWRE